MSYSCTVMDIIKQIEGYFPETSSVYLIGDQLLK